MPADGACSGFMYNISIVLIQRDTPLKKAPTLLKKVSIFNELVYAISGHFSFYI